MQTLRSEKTFLFCLKVRENLEEKKKPKYAIVQKTAFRIKLLRICF